MLPRIWNKYTKVEEIKSHPNIKIYLARVEPVVKIIITKDDNERSLIKEKLENLKRNINGIYEIIEDDNKIYVVLDNNRDILLRIDELLLEIEGIHRDRVFPFETNHFEEKNALIPGEMTNIPMTSHAALEPILPQELQELSLQNASTPILPEEITNRLPDTTIQTPVTQDSVSMENTLNSFMPQENPTFIPSIEEQTMPVIDQEMSAMPPTNVAQISVMPPPNIEQNSAIPPPTFEEISDINTNVEIPSIPNPTVGQVAAIPNSTVEQPSYTQTTEIPNITSSHLPVAPALPPLSMSTPILNNSSIISIPTTSSVMISPRAMANTSLYGGSSIFSMSGRLTNAILDEDFQRKRPLYSALNKYKANKFKKNVQRLKKSYFK